MSCKSRRVLAVAALTTLAAASTALAQSTTWVPTPLGQAWDSPASWTNGVPGPTTTAIFGTSANGETVNTFVSNGSPVMGSMQISATADFDFNDFGALTWGGAINITRLSSAAGTHTLRKLRFDSLTGTWNISGAGSLRVDEPISAGVATALTKTGTGTVVFGTRLIGLGGSTSTWTGSVAVNAGSVSFVRSGINESQVTGVLDVSVASGAFTRVNGYQLGTFTLNGTGQLAAGAMLVEGDATVEGIHAASNASFSVSPGVTLDTSTLSSANASVTLTKRGSGTVRLEGNSSFSGNFRVDEGEARARAPGPLGTGGLIVDSGGTFRYDPPLSAVGSVSGPTTISGTGSASQGAIFVNTSRTLNLQQVTLAADASVNVESNSVLGFQGPVSSPLTTRTLTKTGIGTLLVTGPSFAPDLVVSAGTVTVSASALGSGNVSVAAGGSLRLDAPGTTSRSLILQGSGLLNAGALRALAPVTLSGSVSIPANTTLYSEAGTLTVSGIISANPGTGLTKTGPGGLALTNAANIYSSLAIQQGSLVVTSNSGIPSGLAANVFAGASIEFNAATFSRSFTLGGTGTDALGAIRNASGVSSVSSTITFNAPSSIHVQAGTLTLSGSLNGAQPLTKNGPGRLTLSGVNSAPSLAIASGPVLLSTSASAPPVVTVSPGATLELNSSFALASSLTLASNGTAGSGALRVSTGTTGSITGPVTLAADATINTPSGTALTLSPSSITDNANGYVLTKSGPGTLTLAGTSAVSGGLIIAGGTARTASDAALAAPGAPVTVSAGARLNFTANTSVSARVFSGTGSLAAESASTVTLSGTSVSDLTLRGPGTFVLNSNASLNNVKPFVGSNVRVTGPASFAQLVSDADLVLDAPTAFDGVVNGPFGSLAINANTTAADFGNAGVLTVSPGATLTVAGSELVSSGGSRIAIGSTNAPGGTLNLTAGPLVLNGALLTNNGTITGPTVVNYGSTAKGAGTFGPVTVTDGGTFSPGNSPAAVTTGPVTWAPGGSYVFEIMSAAGTPGAAYDTWNVQGLLDIAAGATANSDFNIVVTTLSSPTTPGPMAGFLPHRPWGWPILTSTSPITSFDPGRVTLDLSGFQNDLGNGTLRLQLTADQQTLLLTYFPGVIPEPAAAALLLPTLPLLSRRRRT